MPEAILCLFKIETYRDRTADHQLLQQQRLPSDPKTRSKFSTGALDRGRNTAARSPPKPNRTTRETSSSHKWQTDNVTLVSCGSESSRFSGQSSCRGTKCEKLITLVGRPPPRPPFPPCPPLDADGAGRPASADVPDEDETPSAPAASSSLLPTPPSSVVPSGAPAAPLPQLLLLPMDRKALMQASFCRAKNSASTGGASLSTVTKSWLFKSAVGGGRAIRSEQGGCKAGRAGERGGKGSMRSSIVVAWSSSF